MAVTLTGYLRTPVIEILFEPIEILNASRLTHRCYLNPQHSTINHLLFPSQPPYTQILWHFSSSRTIPVLDWNFTVRLHHFVNQPLELCQACYRNDNAIPFEFVLLLNA
jgi:hypothetical protein